MEPMTMTISNIDELVDFILNSDATDQEINEVIKSTLKVFLSWRIEKVAALVECL
jgi:hypothetical protein